MVIVVAVEAAFAALAAGVVSVDALAAVAEPASVFLQQFQEKLMRVVLLLFQEMEIQIPVFSAGVDTFPENSFGETGFLVLGYCLVAPVMIPELVPVSLLP